MSLATGIVARGQRRGITDENIRQGILDTWGDIDAMHGLFQPEAPNQEIVALDPDGEQVQQEIVEADPPAGNETSRWETKTTPRP
jgi:hypothetical protein